MRIKCTIKGKVTQKRKRQEKPGRQNPSKTPTRMSGSIKGPGDTPKGYGRDRSSNRNSKTITRAADRTPTRNTNRNSGLLGSIFVADELKSVELPKTPHNEPAGPFSSEIKKTNYKEDTLKKQK